MPRPEEARTRLALRAAVDVDDHGPRAREAGARLVEEARDRPAVEALPAHELRLREACGVEPARLALGPALERAGRGVERRRSRPASAPRRATARGRGRCCATRARPPGRRAAGRAAPASPCRSRGVEQVQHVHAFLVGHERDRLAVGREREAVDVPRDVRRQVAVRAAAEVEMRQALELRVLVGRDVDALAVGAEARAAVRDGLAALRRDERLLAGGHVDQPDVALVDRDELEHGELLVVGRPVGRRPAAALHLEQQPRRAGSFGSIT